MLNMDKENIVVITVYLHSLPHIHDEQICNQDVFLTVYGQCQLSKYLSADTTLDSISADKHLTDCMACVTCSRSHSAGDRAAHSL